MSKRPPIEITASYVREARTCARALDVSLQQLFVPDTDKLTYQDKLDRLLECIDAVSVLTYKYCEENHAAET